MGQSSNRLFHVVVVLGATITSSDCGGATEDRAANPDASDDESEGSAGSSAMGGVGGSAGYDAAAATAGTVSVATGGTGFDAHPTTDVQQPDAQTPTVCVAGPNDCNDRIDNDGDGKIDARDRDCASVCGSECPPPVCNNSRQPCGESCISACPAGMFCLSGCCTILPA